LGDGDWKALVTIAARRDWVRRLAFSPDRKMLATGSKDSTVKLWDVATGRRTK
jgi:WD40 repeat protein